MVHKDFYIITLETTYWVQRNHYESSDHYVDDLLEEIKVSRKKDDKDFILIATINWEYFLLNDIKIWKELFDSFNKKNIKTMLILDSHFKKTDTSSLNTEIHYINYFIWRTWHNVIDQNICGHNEKWNSKADKFIMLTGKPHRPHRIRLLWKLEDMLDKAIWSLHVHDGTFHECRKLIPEIDDNKFANFVNKYKRNPDNIAMEYLKNTTHYGGIPYDPIMYKDTLFSVVSECHFDVTNTRSPWLTEKTFIAILNHMPFILAGDNNSLLTLKELGFKTFENYLPKLGYDITRNREHKLDLIVQNVRYWLTDMDRKEQINQDVEHNYTRFMQLARENKQNLESICLKHNLDTKRIDEIINPHL